MSNTTWTSCFTKPEVDGFKIDLQYIHVGEKVSDTLYKATTEVEDKNNRYSAPWKVVQFGNSMGAAVANLMNYLEMMKSAVQPAKPNSHV